jgi:hypothetical protein
VKEVYSEARKKSTHFDFAMDLNRLGCGVKEFGRKGTDESMTFSHRTSK